MILLDWYVVLVDGMTNDCEIWEKGDNPVNYIKEEIARLGGLCSNWESNIRLGSEKCDFLVDFCGDLAILVTLYHDKYLL